MPSLAEGYVSVSDGLDSLSTDVRGIAYALASRLARLETKKVI